MSLAAVTDCSRDERCDRMVHTAVAISASSYVCSFSGDQCSTFVAIQWLSTVRFVTRQCYYCVL